jgi:hypothetical protein
MDIMKKLTDAVTDKKNPHCREGALFAFEMLCNMLGRLFEPYIVHMLPHLLLCFGDPVDYVRTAADETAKGLCFFLFCFCCFVYNNRYYFVIGSELPIIKLFKKYALQ